MTWEIREGDALDRLRELEEGSVQTCITSPPYWGLRDYGDEGQLGLERTPEEYVGNLVTVLGEVRRVLRDDGTLWLNLGDCYATGAGKVGDRPGGSGQGDDWRERGPMTQPNRMPLPGLKPKDLVGIPWRVAFALQADGWWLRSDIIWAKPNPMPESITDRPTKAHEYLFLLTKQQRYFYDAEAIREDGKDWSKGGPGVGILSTEHYGVDNGGNGGLADLAARYKEGEQAAGRNKRTVWNVATLPYVGAHFATFPPKLVLPCVLAGTPPKVCGRCGAPWQRVLEATGRLVKRQNGPGTAKAHLEAKGVHGDTSCLTTGHTQERVTVGWVLTCDHDDEEDSGRALVLDPFSGAATTGLVAAQQGRDYLGFELNPEYAEMGRERIRRWERDPSGHLKNAPEPVPGQMELL